MQHNSSDSSSDGDGAAMSEASWSIGLPPGTAPRSRYGARRSLREVLPSIAGALIVGFLIIAVCSVFLHPRLYTRVKIGGAHFTRIVNSHVATWRAERVHEEYSYDEATAHQLAFAACYRSGEATCKTLDRREHVLIAINEHVLAHVCNMTCATLDVDTVRLVRELAAGPGASLARADVGQETLLHVAPLYASDLIAHIVQDDVDARTLALNRRDMLGRTPLRALVEAACFLGEAEWRRFDAALVALLVAGADPRAADECGGCTLVERARECIADGAAADTHVVYPLVAAGAAGDASTRDDVRNGDG